MRIGSWIAVAGLSIVAPARADDGGDDRRVLACRPTLACTADLAAPGMLELEIGDQLRRDPAAVYDNATPFLLKLPVARWLEAQVSGNHYTTAPGARYLDNLADAAPIAPRDLGAIAAIEYAVRPWLVVDAAAYLVVEDTRSIAGPAGVSIAPVRLWGYAASQP